MNDELSLLGRMMRVHMQNATPILYHKLQAWWPIILIIIVITILVVGVVAP